MDDKQVLQVLDGMIKQYDALKYLKEVMTVIADKHATLKSTSAAIAAAQEQVEALEKTVADREARLTHRMNEKQTSYKQSCREMDEDLATRQEAADRWKASLATTEAEHAAQLATWRARIDTAKQELATVHAQLDQAQAHRASLMASLQPV